MASRRYTLLDVFTTTPLQGNGLAVVHDADGLPDATMHALARETKLSETSFVQSSSRPEADYRHRIWMVSGEIPFAGHPSLGTAVAVARAREVETATYVQETQAGLQPIDLELDGTRARASMLQEPARFGPELEPAEVLTMVGLEAAVAHPELAVRVVSTGAPQVVAPVRDAAAVDRARPDYAAIGALLARYGAIVLYLASVDPAGGTAYARSFTATAEMGEDPATGAAAGPLCAHAARETGTRALEIAQGVRMGRPSVLRTSVEGDRVRVGGDVVILAEGTLHLDV